MKFSYKLRKILDPEIFASAREHIHRALHPLSAHKMWRELERDPRWAQLRQKYPRGVKEVHRFGDTKFWIKRNVERAQDLSLDRGKRCHILDLGCGPGFFLYVVHKLGHSGIGLDVDQQPIFRDTLALLEVKRIVHEIRPRQPLPVTKQKFDLITSYLTCFHRLGRLDHGNWQTWSAADWQFFIDDVRQNQLAPNGTLLLEFHPQKDGELYSPEVAALFKKDGARLFRSKVFLK